MYAEKSPDTRAPRFEGAQPVFTPTRTLPRPSSWLTLAGDQRVIQCQPQYLTPLFKCAWLYDQPYQVSRAQAQNPHMPMIGRKTKR